LSEFDESTEPVFEGVTVGKVVVAGLPDEGIGVEGRLYCSTLGDRAEDEVLAELSAGEL